MHPSSYAEMQKCYNRYIRETDLETRDDLRILDIGGLLGDQGYMPIFRALKGRNTQYLASGLSAAPTTNLVVEDPYKLPFGDGEVDVIISGQVFEHSEFFWLLFAEMVRVINPDGYMFLITPSGGWVHRAPVDCYRFNPDAYRALAKYTQSQLIDVWRLAELPWCDLVGVFRKHHRPPSAACSEQFALANQEKAEKKYASAVARYRSIEWEFGNDQTFLTNYCEASWATEDWEETFRLGLKLAEGFDITYWTLLFFGMAAQRLRRYPEIRGLVHRMRYFPSEMLRYFGWEMAYGNQISDQALVNYSALEAAKAIVANQPPKPYPEWAISLLKDALLRYGHHQLLNQIDAVTEVGAA